MAQPRVPMTGPFLTIRALLPALNEQEQKVGQYVLERADDVIHLSIDALSQCCAVSNTTNFALAEKRVREAIRI